MVVTVEVFAFQGNEQHARHDRARIAADAGEVASVTGAALVLAADGLCGLR